MDSSSEYPEMMDTHQVARYLRVKERKVYELLKDRRIPCTRVTGKWLFPKIEIDAWLKRNSAQGSAGSRSGSAAMVVAGSHDPLLEWCLREVGGSLAMLPGSSADGLARVAAGEAALAGLHLLDPESGEYNIPHVRQALAEHNVVLVEWARRQQGLVVAAGNPLGIAGVADLAQHRHRVALRQQGAGSRVLFQRLLAEAGLSEDDIMVVGTPVRSETDMGLAILEGTADAGLAVASVAQTLKLGFVPLCGERFDLVIDRQAYFEPAVQALLAFARTPEFAARAAALGGYDITGTGAIRWNAAGSA
ncbi:molybdenum ABC transporter substrate-binding protein [Paramagnetospirillum marisnigri]|uniref:Molybdenum ABC transporter substrate-binding protein n=1 Tax=Paramagnetospirillum marisnigri TaxID=1285242 RepID=A0A178MSX3_9PROT|nr:helix-turn-helix transcriptional regulator [Paramagnetospirillum marisnigri]OAN52750.1 molybdenum ABC transporter substrate-binding protein [Paramagnetospirillum marisnigri]